MVNILYLTITFFLNKIFLVKDIIRVVNDEDKNMNSNIDEKNIFITINPHNYKQSTVEPTKNEIIKYKNDIFNTKLFVQNENEASKNGIIFKK